MNKLSPLLISTILATPHVFGMRTEAERNLLELKEIPYDIKKNILLIKAKNSHRCFPTEPRLVKRFISSIGCINKDLYEEINTLNNDPLFAQQLIANLAITSEWHERVLAEMLNTPGAKKCIELSEQLYKGTLTTKKLKNLFNEGALLNYEKLSFHNCNVLAYWIAQKDNPKTIAIVRTLLRLGADATYIRIPETAPFAIALEKNSKICKATKLKLLLKYKKNDFTFIWDIILKHPFSSYHPYLRILNLLIAKSSKKDLNEGLLYCIKKLPHELDIIKIFIKHGANPDIALFESLKRIVPSAHKFNDVQSVQTFTYLCDQRAFDQKTLDELKTIHNYFGELISKLEKNKPSDHSCDSCVFDFSDL